MNDEERGAIVATVGLGVTALGTLLPWARIGGRSRSGFNTADTFISLADGALPDQIAWIGRWWYLPALLTFVAWASTFFSGRWWLRLAGVLMLLIGAAMWWLFVWAGRHYGLLDTKLVGPVVTSVGLLTIATICGRRRHSLVRPLA